MSELELEEIQTLVLEDVSDYESACFMLFQVKDSDAAQTWLSDLMPRVSFGPSGAKDWFLNIGFSYEGLAHLTLPAALLTQLPAVFSEGMASAYRQRVLGDFGENEPSKWQWGFGDQGVDLFIALYAPNDGILVKEANLLKQSAKRSGMHWIKTLHTEKLADNKEHFGFRDGISQPKIKGLDALDVSSAIEPGEFIFGYPNEYGATVSPYQLPVNFDKSRCLPSVRTEAGESRDFSKNGTFLVVRQLRQDVKAFWKAMAELSEKTMSELGEKTMNELSEVAESEEQAPGYGAREAVRLASKMVGRWPNGVPLVDAPHAEPSDSGGDTDSRDQDATQAQARDLNSFNFKNDPHGMRCPIGAHIRRANPRDSLTLHSKKRVSESVKQNKRHRLLRRGRPYGKPLVASMNPQDMMQAKEDKLERGLIFLSINSDIERQFEFIQQAWLNNTKYDGLYDEVDPLLGSRSAQSKDQSHVFTVPGDPLRKRCLGLQSFVQTRGGGYFFMPSRSALKFLATPVSSHSDTEEAVT